MKKFFSLVIGTVATLLKMDVGWQMGVIIGLAYIAGDISSKFDEE